MAPSSDPILLLHGQPGGARDWDRVIAAIGSRAETIAMYRPGWDGTRRPADLDGNAEAALAELDRHGAQRATIVGHSFGAAVAAWIAARHPERAASLVLAAPAANVASLNRLDYLLAAPVSGPLVSAGVLAVAGLALATAPVRRRIARGLAVDERYLDAAWRVLLSPASWRTFLIEQRILIRELPVLEAQLGAISAPTTVVAGTADRIVPPSAARKLASEIPGAELVLIDGADHLLPILQPVRLAELILAAAGR